MSARIEFTQPITPPTPPTPPYSPDYGAFYSNLPNQATAPFVPALVAFQVTSFSKGITYNGVQFTIANAGIYDVQISIQVSNIDTQDHLFYVWFSQNGTTIPDSASVATIPRTHGGHNGHYILAMNLLVETTLPNEYIQLYWSNDDANIIIETITGVPPIPDSPAAILTITQVS